MKKIFFILFLLPKFALCQVSDNFTDGDFTINPAWTGDTTEFKISTSKQLQLNATIIYTAPSDTAYLCTANSLVNNVEWNFWAKLSFATSANNNGRVYLVSDQANLEGSLNGYFVQLGDFGDSKDSISLFKQAGTDFTKIINGTIVYTNNSTNYFRIKVTRDNSGSWSLYSDPAGGANFQLEGTAIDNTITTTAYFGVFCKYTSSNDTKFYFDDFYVGPIQVDTVPPDISSVLVNSPTQLDIQFSENVDTTTAENISNYSVNNGIGNPVIAAKDATNGTLVHITFPSAFTQSIIYSIAINNVQDVNHNTMLPDIKTFALYFPQAFDVVINELMADPDPPVSLPNYEYAELYNRTPYAINLYKWVLTMGSSIKVFPTVTIDPDSFLIICSQTAEPLFAAYGSTLAFSSFSLTNTGQTVTLSDSLGHIIHSVSYTDSWYQDVTKEDGGWSLEMTDPLNPCSGESNWRASISPQGGTPGSVNSINVPNSDNSPPQLIRVSVIDNNSIEIYFSEPMDSIFLLNPQNYIIDNGIGNPTISDPVGPDFSSVVLYFTQAIQTGTVYKVTVTDTLEDCVGNFLPVNSWVFFAIPEIPSANELVINEVLSNPKDDGADYVELYNRSNKVLDLKDLAIASFDTIHAVLTDINNLSPDGYLVFPQNYVVLTTNAAMVKSQYQTPNPNGFAQQTALPSLNNDDGIVVITLKNTSTVIDMFTYTADMYFPLLNSTDGVSLERINFDRPTNDKTNWHSAAEAVGFGTPAYRNSQFSDGVAASDPVNVSPEIFSPDNDGNNDVLNINYQFDVAGYVGAVVIYDARGRLVRNLKKNELLGTSGSFSWDGITNENEKARIGIYIVYFEVFDLNGNTKHYKKTAVLAGKL